MIFQVITTFPQLIRAVFEHGVVGGALKSGALELRVANPRDFTTDVHHSVDDRPYGGGDGMVLLAGPLRKALASFPTHGHVVYLTPQGTRWSDARARQFARREFYPCVRPQLAPARGADEAVITLVCGRYAGVDQRFLDQHVADEISVGDFVLSGGELAAAVVIDSVARHLEGTLGNRDSAAHDSFARGLLEGPCWTRPKIDEGRAVPEILVRGNHAHVAKWRHAMSWFFTAHRRPDLLSVQPPGDDQALREVREGLSYFSSEDFARVGLRDRKMADALLNREMGDALLNREMADTPAPRLSRLRPIFLAMGLVHWPVLNKAGEVVCTNVTTLDVHDLARTAKTYALDHYVVINRQEGQRAFVERLLDHWKTGDAMAYNEMRQRALKVVVTATTVETATREWHQRLLKSSVAAMARASGPDGIIRIGTSAAPQAPHKTIHFQELREYLKAGTGPLLDRGFGEQPILLLFGTGYGLAPELDAQIDFWLEPIRGGTPEPGEESYRHLSVRAAVSICLDRLLGTW